MIMMVDSVRIQQILLNFLSNAIKFSANKSVLISICSKELTSKIHEIQVNVTDFGIGISEQDKVNLFKPYYKTTSAASRQINPYSNGLGLSICAEISKRLGGKVSVESKLNEGTTFTLVFPAEEVNPIEDNVPPA